MIYRFRWYLHDEGADNAGDMAEDIEWMIAHQWQLAEPLRDGSEAELTPEVALEILEGKPFYEVRLTCQYDSDTREVTVISAKPQR